MSSFSFGFVISELSVVNETKNTELERPIVKIWGRNDFHHDLSVSLKLFVSQILFMKDVICVYFFGRQDVREKVIVTLRSLQAYLGVEFPLKKLDIVALPGFSAVKPVDNWGLLVFK